MTVHLRVIRNEASISVRGGAPSSRVKCVFPAIVAPIVEPLEMVVAHSIEELDRREWDVLFPNEPGDWHYLRALERAQLERCESICFAVRSRGRILAAAPAFVGRRALAEPWPARGRAQWRRSIGRALVLGSPFASVRRVGFAPRTTMAGQRLLADRLLRAACEEAARRGLDGLEVNGDDGVLADACERESLRLTRGRSASVARVSLPRWSLADYLSCFDNRIRAQVLRICARSGRYDRDWRVDLDRDVGAMLALCRDAGLDEVGEKFFRQVLGSSTFSAKCLLVRGGDRALAGFSVVLHDTRALCERLTVVSRRENGELVRGVIWLETLRLCLERGIGTYESASSLALSAAGPNELLQRSGWIAVRDRAGA